MAKPGLLAGEQFEGAAAEMPPAPAPMPQEAPEAPPMRARPPAGKSARQRPVRAGKRYFGKRKM